MKKELLKYMNLPNKSVVMLQSGGLDSCVCSTLLEWAKFQVIELFIDYGQSALEKEYAMAKAIAKENNHKLTKVKIDIPWWKTLPIVGGVVESDGINEVNKGVADPESYIPLRNQVLISIAGSLAEHYHIPYICTGLNGSQDILGRPLEGYVDAHQKFADKIEASLNEGSTMYHQKGRRFKVLTPLMGMNKADVVGLGFEIEANFKNSWSCFNNGDEPCGHCNSCVGREQGFSAWGQHDPLLKNN